MIYNRFNREISCHHVTVSLHHRITASLCQSVICLAPCHKTSQSFALPPAPKPVSHLPCPYHHITVSQSFALPPATKPVSHLPCPLPPNQSVICLVPYHRITASLCHCITLPPCHRVTTLVSHLPCPLPPNQSVICLALYHHILHHRISQSFALPPATKPVSHLPCPLPPNQSVICLAPYHHVTASPH